MRTFIFIRMGIIGMLALPLTAALAEEASVEQIMENLEQTPPQVSTDVLLNESREQYVAGGYSRAGTGFEMVLAREPNNVVARYYLDKMSELDQRNAEEGAMKQVSQAWGGMLLRDYPVSAATRRMLNLEEAEAPVDISAGFPEVSFPKGTYVIYRPQLSRIFALNKPEEIQRLETILISLDGNGSSGADQVEIETRFVEFSEGALEELGFNWSDVLDGSSAASAGDWELADGADLFKDSLRTVPFSQTGSLGLGEIAATGDGNVDWINRIEDSFGTEAGTLNVSGTLDSTAIDLLIRALDQTSGVDVLSAPRIVTVTGKEAVIQVGQRHYYPETYEEGVSGGTVLHVRYEDFEEKLLGVELKVTPTIKGDEIGLKLNPKITDLIGWEQFELAPADTSYTYYQYRVGMQFEHEPVVAKLPVFKEREVQTEVTVQDGATVGMGGLISEKLEAFEDRVPVLGSIPLVGRLFRSEGERSVKRNLMIFVTAKKVQPNGTMVAGRNFQ
ncbi:MAG: hypothetical protein JEZ10_00655 [Verrucomicrobia bacterium]|nr:hypothetical protein [Verrucomicrobiota bacterium]